MLQEQRNIIADERNRERIIFQDNVSSHDETNEVQNVLNEIKTSLRYFPSSTTHKVQLLDTGILKVFKDE